MNYILCSSVTLYDIYSIISQEYGKLFVTVVLYLYILFKSNQILFCNNNNITFICKQQKQVLLRGGHMARYVPSSCDPKYKCRNLIYLFTYVEEKIVLGFSVRSRLCYFVIL